MSHTEGRKRSAILEYHYGMDITSRMLLSTIVLEETAASISCGTLKVEAVFSETFATTYKYARCHILKERRVFLW